MRAQARSKDQLSEPSLYTGGWFFFCWPHQLAWPTSHVNARIASAKNGNGVSALSFSSFGGWQVSETVFLHSGLPFSVFSAPYTVNNHGVFQGSRPQYANRVPGVPVYRKTGVPGVTQAGSLQWLNPDAFASVC
jgi:hypothetical protein